MKSHKNHNYTSVNIVNFQNISIIKLNKTLLFNFKRENNEKNFYKIPLLPSIILFNNIKKKKIINSTENKTSLVLHRNFYRSFEKKFYDNYFIKKKIFQILGKVHTRKGHMPCAIQQTLCSNIAWEFFFLEFNDFTNYSQNTVHAYSLFMDRHLVRIARSGYSFLTKIPLDMHVFRKNPTSTGCALLHKESRERMLCESLLVGSRDFYAQGEYRLRLLAVGIGFPLITSS